MGSEIVVITKAQLKMKVVAKRIIIRMNGALYFEVLRKGCLRL